MRYWWVNHGKTYEFEVPGDFLWSPKTQIDGSRSQHYDFMTEIEPGDFVFSHSEGKIRALGVAISPAYTSPKPEFRTKGSNWSSTGWQVDVSFKELKEPFEPQKFFDEIKPLLPEKYSPMQSTGKVQQAYLFEISQELFQVLLSHSDVKLTALGDLKPYLAIKDSQDEIHEIEITQRVNIGPLEKENLVKSRRGQGIFKTNVKMIEKECRVTKLSDKDFLIASHIKPWKDSNDAEKIDGNNGLLLSPHIDKLFDSGLISFADNGDLLISSKLNLEVLKIWGIERKLNAGGFSSEQKVFLKFHRENRFKV
jgi:putative restriction endonuclease